MYDLKIAAKIQKSFHISKHFDKKMQKKLIFSQYLSKMAENRSKKSICQQFPTIGQLLFSIVKNVQKWGKKDKTKKNEARRTPRIGEFGEIAPKSEQPRVGNLIALK